MAAITALLAAAAAIGILVLLARCMLRAHLSALLVRGLFLLAGLLPATLLLTTLSLVLILAGLLLAALIVLVHVFLQLIPGVGQPFNRRSRSELSIHCELIAHGNFLSNFPVQSISKMLTEKLIQVQLWIAGSVR